MRLILQNQEGNNMQRVLSFFQQAFCRNILVFGLIILTSLSGLFIFVQSPSYATTVEELKLNPERLSLTPEDKINRAYEYNRGTGVEEEIREEAYEQALKDGENLNTMEKAYERNVKTYEAENPAPSLGEKVKEAVKNVTNK
jgi:hypothetical protein